MARSSPRKVGASVAAQFPTRSCRGLSPASRHGKPSAENQAILLRKWSRRGGTGREVASHYGDRLARGGGAIDMRRSRYDGFTLIELLMVVAIIGIIAAIAIPSLLRSRQSANEASAIASMRSISSAQSAYAASCGFGYYAMALEDLAAALGRESIPRSRSGNDKRREERLHCDDGVGCRGSGHPSQPATWGARNGLPCDGDSDHRRRHSRVWNQHNRRHLLHRPARGYRDFRPRSRHGSGSQVGCREPGVAGSPRLTFRAEADTTL